MKPYEAIDRLGELEMQFQDYPANHIPVIVLLEERKLREELVKADLDGGLDYGTTEDRPEDLGSLDHIAHKLLEEYTVQRSLSESKDLEELNKGASEEERIDGIGLRLEAETYFYAAKNLLMFQAIGDPLDSLARKFGDQCWDDWGRLDEAEDEEEEEEE